MTLKRSWEIGVKQTDDSATMTGFYRYTDILFRYPAVFDDLEEASALKRAIHYNALGDPSHPLRTDKEKGIGLYIGTLPNGQLCLMFSSAQVEYMRYLLHATGLTRRLLSLPSSDYLLMGSVLTNVSTVYLKTPAEVKKAYMNVKKNSRKLKNDSILTSFRHNFDEVRELYASKKGAWLAIDIEAWSVIHSAITEFGWSCIRWNGAEELHDKGHLIDKKNKTLRNGQYAADAQNKYVFGASLELETMDFKKAVGDLIKRLQESGPLFLVFHDYRQDIEFLKNPRYFDEGLPDTFTHSLPNGIPDEGTFIVDTSELFGALEGNVSQKRSLGDMCRLLNIETQYLHNAGNDAHYTLLALKSMALGNQVDAQREERWPSRDLASNDTGSSMKIIHLPEDEDSDYSQAEDEE